MSNQPSRITSHAFTFELGHQGNLSAVKWENHLAGTQLDFTGGTELRVQVDAAKARIWIEGWHWRAGERDSVEADAETGFRQGWQLPDHRDIRADSSELTGWKRNTNLLGLFDGKTHWGWARSRFFLPEKLAGEKLTFTLGGFGVGDFRQTRVFVNGTLAGVRRTGSPWFEPGVFELKPGSEIYSHLRFGQINILALQLGGSINRNERLEENDPAHAFHWPYPHLVHPVYFQHIEAGEHPVVDLTFAVQRCGVDPDGNTKVVLAAEEFPLQAEVTYCPSGNGLTLKKQTKLINVGSNELRIMNVCLGDYRMKASATEGDMGSPVHVDQNFFFALEHPAGYVMGEEGRVRLRQFPGISLAPGESFSCMTAVFGVSETGKSGQAFLDYLTPRMRRNRRGHDKPLAILSMYGSWPIPEGEMLGSESFEDVYVRCADWLKEFHRKTGERFDLASVDFWQDPSADLVSFNEGFPDGFDHARQLLGDAGVRYGLWIDSSRYAKWHIGLNPLMQNCLAGAPSYAVRETEHWGASPMCRAAEPLRSIFQNAFLEHINNGGARLLKFDNLVSVCHNQHHGHWPGVYSTEVIYDSVIQFLSALDSACPEVFLMLYWGYRSPWWLLHGDVLFECGLKIEAATPSATPSLRARDGVTLTLDQAVAYAADMPKSGKDSLGIWLSRWPWNSSIGKEGWREAMIMDMARGNLLFQPWMGEDELDDHEIKDLADFLRLLRLGHACFRNARLVLGDPLQNEPYGYICRDGDRAFLAINNFSWKDLSVALNSAQLFGPEAELSGSIVRHYPRPAKPAGADDWLRPFEVALYEFIPVGQQSTGEKVFCEIDATTKPEELSREVAVEATKMFRVDPQEESSVVLAGVYDAVEKTKESWSGYHLRCKAPVSRVGGVLVVCAIASCAGRTFQTGSMGSFFRVTGKLNGDDAIATPVLANKSYPSSWQAWRIPLPCCVTEQNYTMELGYCLGDQVQLEFRAHFLPSV